MRVLLVIALAGCGDNALPECASWQQWGNDAAHDGKTCASGQPLGRALGGMQFDPFVPAEQVDARGDLTVHYQAPLIDGDDFYMMTKTGTYTPCDVGSGSGSGSNVPACFNADELHRLDSQVWTETKYGWDGKGAPVERWSYDSDWKPMPWHSFEPMFQPALLDDRIVIPGAGGSLWELDQSSGKVVSHIEPFGAIDALTFVAGALTVANGTIYYNVIQLDAQAPYANPSHAWLVAVDRDGGVRKADYATLVPGAPAPADPCYGSYNPIDVPLPWPPPPNPDGTPVLPMQFECGGQVPGVNTAITVADDGTLYAVTRAQYNERYSYIVALHADLTPKWATSLRGLFADGCGVLVPSDADGSPSTLFDCRIGAPAGVEPFTGLLPAAAVDDSSSSSPIALPGGGVLYGAFTAYNGSRGHLLKLDADGKFAADYDFGWDTTPAVVAEGSSYSIVLKDNHYGTDAKGVDLGPYYITKLDASLRPVWQFESTETQSCTTQPDGSLACVADHPHGFEWCINAPAVDANGVVYANSEDGHLYAITADGQLRDRMFLDRALGAAYTPVALDHTGRVYALNSGTLTIVGR